MSVTIYHNPDCGTSRNVLAALERLGLQAQVIEYLKTPPDAQTLASLIKAAGISVRDAIRVKGTPYKELGLDGGHWSDAKLIEQMVQHPILINRPIVSTEQGVQLCRPSDVILDLVDVPDQLSLQKEEGVPFLRDARVLATDPALGQALVACNLASDRHESATQFFQYSSTDGVGLAHAGMDVAGEHAVIHSVVVDYERRRQGLGRNVLALLLRRAFEQGARHAWVVTGTAGGFFESSGFRESAPETAPQDIQASPSMHQRSAAGATLYSRKISL